jgi:hypothetical protein
MVCFASANHRPAMQEMAYAMLRAIHQSYPEKLK